MEYVIIVMIIAGITFIKGRKKYPVVKKPAIAVMVVCAGVITITDFQEKHVRPLEIALSHAYGSGKYPLTTCNVGTVQNQRFARCYSSQLWKVTESESGYVYQPYNGKALAGMDKMLGHLPEGHAFDREHHIPANPSPTEVWAAIPWDK